jgi:hypothetical protein
MTEIPAPEKVPAWLVAAADQRIEHMVSHIDLDLLKVENFAIITMPLTEPGIPPGQPMEYEVWDKSCDNCRKFCPDHLFTTALSIERNGVKILVMVGACEQCWALP